MIDLFILFWLTVGLVYALLQVVDSLVSLLLFLLFDDDEREDE